MTHAATSRTATFLLTDIEGSTRLWQAHRDTMGAALATHDAILRAAVENSGGTLVKATGDGILAAFDRPDRALAAAIEAQRALVAQEWPATGPIRVRMAIHTGVAEERDGDWFGPTLNRVARLLAIGHGGQVLLSGAAAAVVEDALPAGMELLNLGQHQLRDIEHAERVYQVGAPGLRRDFPALRSSSPQSNLPVELTSFVGREQELDEVKRLLAAYRLVTLVGVGGTGKTRLMLRAARAAVDQYEDGVWLVELGPIAEPALVTQEVARALAIPEAPGQPVLATVIDYLRDKQLLLLLDNCEHLVEAVADLVHRLLAACPPLRVLATSREGLGVPGESIHQVPSLGLPDDSTGADGRVRPEDDAALGAARLDAIRAAEAVQLFRDRARVTLPAFEVDASTAASVVEICRRLDGIPLAIELAAARVNVLSAAEIAQGLGDRFRLLTGGRRSGVPRQQTLQAMIDWSWELLSPDDQRMLRRLSVLNGEWTLDQAVEVARETGDDAATARLAAIDGLARLVDRSLVIAEHRGATRYRMLETIRQYARDRLIASGEAPAIRDRHLAWFRSLVMTAIPYLDGPDVANWLGRLDQEVDNLRAALDWAYETDVEAALEITVGLANYWRYRSSGSEGTDRMEQAVAALDRLPDPPTDGRARRAALASRVLSSAVMSVTTTGRADGRARAWVNRSVALARESGDPRALVYALGARGLSTVFAGPGAKFLEPAEVDEVISLGEAGGMWSQVAFALAGTAIHGARTNPDGTAALLDRATQAAVRSGNPSTISFIVIFRGRALAFRELDEARRSFGDAIAANEALGDRRQVLVTRSDLAHTLRHGGAGDEAEAIYRETIVEWHHLGQRGAVANQLESFAYLALARGQAWRAAVLLGAADRLRADASAYRADYEEPEHAAEMARLHAALDPSEFAASWAQGQSMGTPDAVALARGG